MESNGQALLRKLKEAHWDVAVHTYGNNHSTLIGILADWWITMSPHTHTVLEGGPTNGYSRKGMRGQCDALLCKNNMPTGVLEVEGSRLEYTARKLGTFFDRKNKYLQDLKFGILLLYTYAPDGRGSKRRFPKAATDSALAEVISISKKHRGKPFVVITIDKNYERRIKGIRACNEYYRGVPNSIQGRLFFNGNEVGTLTYFELS